MQEQQLGMGSMSWMMHWLFGAVMTAALHCPSLQCQATGAQACRIVLTANHSLQDIVVPVLHGVHLRENRRYVAVPLHAWASVGDDL